MGQEPTALFGGIPKEAVMQLELLRLSLDAVPAGIAMFDSMMRYIATSRTYRESLGVSDVELVGRSHYAVFPEIPERWKEIHRRCLAGATERAEADEFIRADGTVTYWHWEIRPWHDRDGQIAGVVMFNTDVTNAVRRERELRRVVETLDNAGFALGISDSVTGRVTYANPAFEALHRIRAGQAVGMPIGACYSPTELARLQDVLAHAPDRQPVVFESRRRRHDGSEFEAETVMTVIHAADGGSSVRIGTVRDISHRRRIEAALREANEDLSTIIQFGPGVFYRARVTDSHVQLLNIYGDLSARMRPDDSADPAAQLPEIATLLQAPAALALLREMAGSAELTSQRVDYAIDPDSANPRWLRNRARVSARHGQMVEIVGYVLDITREVEEQQRLARVATLVTLGELATSMAHELNQPLASISFAAQNAARMLSTDPGNPAPVEKRLTRIDSEAQRASRMLDHMKVFARNEQHDLQATTWQDALVGALDLLASRLRLFTVIDAVPPDLPPVLGAPIAMEQLLINLIGNAMDAYEISPPQARPPGSPITVSGRVANGHVVLRVEDQAGGIPTNLLSRIFEPFFTTKPAGKGTGLGLALCFRTVNGMGGTLTAANHGSGAAFEICLPVLRHDQRPARADVAPPD